MNNFEELIERLTNNIIAIDPIFKRLDYKHEVFKKYILKINKEYLSRVDSWYFNDNTNNQYLRITNKKLSELLFGNKISINRVEKLIPALVELNLLTIIKHETYEIPKYNINEIVQKSIINSEQINDMNDKVIKKKYIKKEQGCSKEESYELIEEYILDQLRLNRYVLSQNIESHFIVNKKFIDIPRRIRAGIKLCSDKHNLLLIMADKMLKVALDIKLGYPKVIITKSFYKEIETETYSCKIKNMN